MLLPPPSRIQTGKSGALKAADDVPLPFVVAGLAPIDGPGPSRDPELPLRLELKRRIGASRTHQPTRHPHGGDMVVGSGTGLEDLEYLDVIYGELEN